MKRLLFILLLTVLAAIVVWPQKPGNYIPGGDALPGNPGIHLGNFIRQGAKLGLDLQGGTQLTLQADMSQIADDQKANAMKGVVNVSQKRVSAEGVAEAEIQTRGTDRLIVQLPGVKDIEEAKKLIGQTAKLEFKEQDATGQWIPAVGTLNGQPVALTGAYLVPGHQQVTFASRAGLPEVAFEFNSDGAQIFQQITSHLVGKPLGIFLDGQQVSAPTVQAVLSSTGVITGLSLDQAHLLALQLNAGALPVPVSIEEERTVDATLGADSVHKSIIAGEIALVVVVAFMLMYYRLPGLAASGALIIYSLLGMAVDANILIFERMKEELRSGKTIAAAIRAGEDRAWPSIRDSNTSTLITCGVLYFFGQQFGATIIMGFALVLAIGVVISLFSAIVVTRTFLELLLGRSWAHNSRLFGMEIAPNQVGGAATSARR